MYIGLWNNVNDETTYYVAIPDEIFVNDERATTAKQYAAIEGWYDDPAFKGVYLKLGNQ